MMTRILICCFAILLVFPLSAQNKLVGFSIYNVPGDYNSGGLLFSVHTDGSDFQVLKNFSAAPVGDLPENTAPLALIHASDGKFYGIAQPWTTGADAFIFSMDPDGTNFQTVFTRSVDWQLVDATSRCALIGHATSPDTWTISLAGLPSGLYFLKIDGLVKKVMKG